MSLETTWFTFRVLIDGADPLEDKIPADSEAEALETVRRIYTGARSIELLRTETRESLFARFRPGMTPTGAASQAVNAILRPTATFTCQRCGVAVTFVQQSGTAPCACSNCHARYTVSAPGEDGPFVVRGESAPAKPTAEPPTRPWHRVLDVEASADLRAIRNAYLNQIRLYHPDKVAHLGPDLIELAETRTAEINEALQSALRARR